MHRKKKTLLGFKDNIGQKSKRKKYLNSVHNDFTQRFIKKSGRHTKKIFNKKNFFTFKRFYILYKYKCIFWEIFDIIVKIKICIGTKTT